MLVTSASGALVLVVLIAARRARRYLTFTLIAFTAGLLVGTATDTLQTLLTHTLTRL